MEGPLPRRNNQLQMILGLSLAKSRHALCCFARRAASAKLSSWEMICVLLCVADSDVNIALLLMCDRSWRWSRRNGGGHRCGYRNFGDSGSRGGRRSLSNGGRTGEETLLKVFGDGLSIDCWFLLPPLCLLTEYAQTIFVELAAIS